MDGLVSSAEIKAVDGKSLSIFFISIIFKEKETTKMRNNIFRKMKSKVSDVCRKVLIPSFAGTVYAVSCMAVTVFAADADTSAVTKPLDSLKTLVIAVIGAVGVIILAKNF